MALILSRVSQRLEVVHDQDPDTDKAIGRTYDGGFRSAYGQPPAATRIAVSPVNGDVWERAAKSDDSHTQIIDAAQVTMDGAAVTAADLAMGWVLSLSRLIREISMGPLVFSPSMSPTTPAGDQSAETPDTQPSES